MDLHPLRRYWLSNRVLNYGKSLAVPERTHQFRQHEGQPILCVSETQAILI